MRFADGYFPEEIEDDEYFQDDGPTADAVTEFATDVLGYELQPWQVDFIADAFARPRNRGKAQ